MTRRPDPVRREVEREQRGAAIVVIAAALGLLICFVGFFALVERLADAAIGLREPVGMPWTGR